MIDIMGYPNSRMFTGAYGRARQGHHLHPINTLHPAHRIAAHTALDRLKPLPTLRTMPNSRILVGPWARTAHHTVNTFSRTNFCGFQYDLKMAIVPPRMV